MSFSTGPASPPPTSPRRRGRCSAEPVFGAPTLAGPRLARVKPPFEVEEVPLHGEAPAVAAQGAVAAEDAVAGHEQGAGVAAARRARRPHGVGPPGPRRQLGVGARDA